MKIDAYDDFWLVYVAVLLMRWHWNLCCAPGCWCYCRYLALAYAVFALLAYNQSSYLTKQPSIREAVFFYKDAIISANCAAYSQPV